MDRYCCPACGARGYRGRRCGQCLYEPFDEEVAHGSHYHAGEPLVLNTRPRSTAPGRGCDSYSGKRIPKITVPKALLIVPAVLILLFFPRAGVPLGLIVLAVNALNKKK